MSHQPRMSGANYYLLTIASMALGCGLVLGHAADQSVIYERLEGRCTGMFQLKTAEPIKNDTYPNGQELDRIVGLPHGIKSCRLACLMHQGCWATNHMTNNRGVEICVLYPEGAIQLTSTGKRMYVWVCQIGKSKCTRPNADRCPGFWMRVISLTIIKNAIEEVTSKNIASPMKCPAEMHFDLKLEECQMACEVNRHCNVLQYRPPAANYSIRSACQLVDENVLFPKYQENPGAWRPKPTQTSRVEEIKETLLSMPVDWITADSPAQLHWYCCSNWWDLLNFDTVEKKVKQTACALRESEDPTESLFCTPREPTTIAGFARGCAWRGYWSVHRHNYSPAISFRTVDQLTSFMDGSFTGKGFRVFQANNKSVESPSVLVISQFYTQNPFECINECTRHPCCLVPIFSLQQWQCILIGPIEGPSVCTTKFESEKSDPFEWGTESSLSQLPVIHTKLILWQYQCCTTPGWFLKRFADYNAIVDRPVDQTFHPEQLTYCLCEADNVKKVYLISDEDMLCTEAVCDFHFENKYANPPTAFLVDFSRPIAVHANGVIQWYRMDHHVWNKGLSTEANDNIWIPVFSTLYMEHALWAGPWTRMKRCPLHHCRALIDNRLSAIGELDENSETGPVDPPPAVVRTYRDWAEPTCTKRTDYKPLDLSQPLPYAIVISTRLPAYRCYSDAACAHYMRKASLYHLSLRWSGLGYNYMIGNHGTIYESRGEKFRGAHTRNFNSKSYGIAFFGWYPSNPPTVDALNALLSLINYLRNKSLLEPKSEITNKDYGPRRAISDWLQTVPMLPTTHRIIHFNEIRCKLIIYQDDSWLLYTCSITVATCVMLFCLGLLIHYLHANHKAGRNLCTKMRSNLFTHTSECQEWSNVCARVGKNGRIFHILDIRVPLYDDNKNNNNHRPNGGLSSTKHKIEASSNSLAYRTCCWERWSIPEFLTAYVHPAPVNIMLASSIGHKAVQKHGDPHAWLFVLFCKSWRAISELHYVVPSLFLFTLSALYNYQLDTDTSLDSVCVELLTDTFDFLVVVRLACETAEHNVQLTELCSNKSILVRNSHRTTHDKRGIGTTKMSCLRCEWCQSLGELSEKKQHNWMFNQEQWIKPAERKTKDELTTPRRAIYGNPVRQVDPLSWVQFYKAQEDRARFVQPIEGRIQTYQQYLAYKDSFMNHNFQPQF